MPRMTSHTANLDSRFVEIQEFNGRFDMCIKTGSGATKMVIPFNWTKHTNKFKEAEKEERATISNLLKLTGFYRSGSMPRQVNVWNSSVKKQEYAYRIRVPGKLRRDVRFVATSIGEIAKERNSYVSNANLKYWNDCP